MWGPFWYVIVGAIGVFCVAGRYFYLDEAGKRPDPEAHLGLGFVTLFFWPLILLAVAGYIATWPFRAAGRRARLKHVKAKR